MALEATIHRGGNALSFSAFNCSNRQHQLTQRLHPLLEFLSVTKRVPAAKTFTLCSVTRQQMIFARKGFN